MGLIRVNNGRCKTGCGNALTEGDVVTFEEAVVQYRGPIEKSIGVIKLNAVA